MFVAQLANFACRTIGKVWGAGTVPIRMGGAPGPRTACLTMVPRIEVETAPTMVTVTYQVPGATSSNVLVSYDDEDNSFAVRVESSASSAVAHDWYVELRMPLAVEGERSTCTLDADTLQIRAPLEDTPGVTGLGVSAILERMVPAPIALALAE